MAQAGDHRHRGQLLPCPGRGQGGHRQPADAVGLGAVGPDFGDVGEHHPTVVDLGLRLEGHGQLFGGRRQNRAEQDEEEQQEAHGYTMLVVVCSISSEVETTLELISKARWVVIMWAISSTRLTLEFST